MPTPVSSTDQLIVAASTMPPNSTAYVTVEPSTIAPAPRRDNVANTSDDSNSRCTRILVVLPKE